VALPVLAPKHPAWVDAIIEAVNVQTGSLSVKEVVAVHPLASVTVTE
jgi:hypothetical protein